MQFNSSWSGQKGRVLKWVVAACPCTLGAKAPMGLGASGPQCGRLVATAGFSRSGDGTIRGKAPTLALFLGHASFAPERM